MAADGQVDVGEIGGGDDEKGNAKKYNQFHVVPVAEIPTVPPRGYVGALLKAANVSELQARLAEVLEVEARCVALAYDGRDLEFGSTFKENNVLEPGPTARKEGHKVELVFSLALDVLPGAALRGIADKQAAAAAAEAELIAKRRKEEADLMAKRKTQDAEVQRKRELEELKQREEHDRAQLAAFSQQRTTFKVMEVGQPETNGFICQLPSKLQVGTFVRQLVASLGLTETSAEGVCLIYADGPLLSEETMERVEPHSKVFYYFVSGPDQNRFGPERFLDMVRVEAFRSEEERGRIEERLQRESDAAREAPAAPAEAAEAAEALAEE